MFVILTVRLLITVISIMYNHSKIDRIMIAGAGDSLDSKACT